MSDLLPLVVATLKDKAAVDAQTEIAQLRKQLGQTYAVEIILDREDTRLYGTDDKVTVFASGSLQEGGLCSVNPRWWRVYLQQDTSATPCKLEDVEKCCLCVGGGISVERLDKAVQDGVWDEEEDIHDFTKDAVVDFFFHSSPYLVTITIKGVPQEEWENLLREYCVDETMEFITNQAAQHYPNTTVEFRHVSFLSTSMHAAFRRMLPADRRAEIDAEANRVA
eukprot:scaffold5688_cov104-Cylindrotheca_fusiformis.AAC.7